MKCARICTRVLMTWVVAFGLVALTAERFDATEILFLLTFCPALLAIEAAVYLSDPDRRSGQAGCGALSVLAVLALILCIAWPRTERIHAADLPGFHAAIEAAKAIE
jgi:hypothetical protein